MALPSRDQRGRAQPLLAVYSRDGEEFSAPAAAADAVTGVAGAADLIAGLAGANPGDGTECPYCGWTDATFSKTGYVGCALCYSSLASLRQAAD